MGEAVQRWWTGGPIPRLVLTACALAACSAANPATTPAGPGGTATPAVHLATPTQVPTPVPCGGQPTCHFDDIGFAFDYPATWRSATFQVVSSFSSDLVYLSTEPLSDPCDRAPNMTSCMRLAAGSLGPGGVLVTWRARAWPGWTFDPTLGRPLTVGGRRATLEERAASEPCSGIGGLREIVVTIPRPVSANWMDSTHAWRVRTRSLHWRSWTPCSSRCAGRTEPRFAAATPVGDVRHPEGDCVPARGRRDPRAQPRAWCLQVRKSGYSNRGSTIRTWTTNGSPGRSSIDIT
jgi:hypothetical protein